MPRLEIKDAQLSFELETQHPASTIDPDIASLLKFLSDFKTRCASLKHVWMQKRGQDLYDYGFDTNDGRKWEQQLRLESGRSLMNFAVADFWDLVEFEAHRPVRGKIEDAIRRYEAVRLEVRW